MRISHAGRLEGFCDLLLIGAHVDERFRLASPPREHQQQALDQQQRDQQDEHRDAERPQPLRDPERRAQHADVGRVEENGFIDQVVGTLGDEAHEHQQRREAEQMHRIAQPRREMIDQHVDADMRARGERVRERPRDAEGERVAGDFRGRLRREAEEAPRDDVEGDERGAQDEPPPRHVAHHRAD